MSSIKKFRNYLVEGRDKNTHLEHLEDSMFNDGVAGTKDALDFLRNLRNMLAGNTSQKVSVTVKWDGAPAIFCGTNPDNGRFFVGSKSVFNKTNPKINYTNSDIDANHQGGLANKLKIALATFPSLGIKGVLQGDLLYVKSDLSKAKIKGESLVTFQPNTITYSVPLNTPLASQIQRSQIGVVFHTTYSGTTLAGMKASFGANVSRLKKTSSVWFSDATFRDESGAATFTSSETKEITAVLSQIGTRMNKMDSQIVNGIAADNKIRGFIAQYNNSKIRAGQEITSTAKHVDGLVDFIKSKYKLDASKLKTAKGQQKKLDASKDLAKYIVSRKQQLKNMFEIMNLMIQAKKLVIKKLEAVKTLGTFIETSTGLKVTSPEGYVAIDHLTGNAVKLVDRMEFSRNNFNIVKKWKR